MQSVRRILVAVKDPSAAQMPAVTKAAQLAIALGAKLELYHALSQTVMLDALTGSAADARRYAKHTRAAAQERLEAIARKMQRHDVQIETSAEWDRPPHEAILRRAERVRADLVVVERHAGTRRAKWLLSYTDWEVLRLSRSPVLLVKVPRPYHRPTILAAVDPTHSHDKPAALDSTIVRWAERLRGALSGRLELVHAFTPPLLLEAGMLPANLTRSPANDPIVAAERQAQRRLDALVERFELDAARSHLINGPAAASVAQVAHKTRSSIVVMGAVSRSALKRIFIGSTAEAVIDSLRADVLVVKPRSFKLSIPRTSRGMSVAAIPTPMY